LTSSREGFSPPLLLGFAVDDLKAYYVEAAAGAAKPSSRQLGDWFWMQPGLRFTRSVRPAWRAMTTDRS
jgi:hypothetical protein